MECNQLYYEDGLKIFASSVIFFTTVMKSL